MRWGPASSAEEDKGQERCPVVTRACERPSGPAEPPQPGLPRPPPKTIIAQGSPGLTPHHPLPGEVGECRGNWGRHCLQRGAGPSAFPGLPAWEGRITGPGREGDGSESRPLPAPQSFSSHFQRRTLVLVQTSLPLGMIVKARGHLVDHGFESALLAKGN